MIKYYFERTVRDIVLQINTYNDKSLFKSRINLIRQVYNRKYFRRITRIEMHSRKVHWKRLLENDANNLLDSIFSKLRYLGMTQRQLRVYRSYMLIRAIITFASRFTSYFYIHFEKERIERTLKSQTLNLPTILILGLIQSIQSYEDAENIGSRRRD